MTTISNHPHPKARTQRIVGLFAGLGLLGALLGSLGLLFIGLAYGLILMLIMIPFLLALSMPLLLLTSLHPAVRVEEKGLHLKPLVFRTSFLEWDAIVGMVEHSLVKPPPPSKIRRRDPHQGEMFLVQPGHLPWHYRMVGVIAGHGFQPVFAISNRTHVDHERLRDTIHQHLSTGK